MWLVTPASKVLRIPMRLVEVIKKLNSEESKKNKKNREEESKKIVEETN
jgi:hypothetical protein